MRVPKVKRRTQILENALQSTIHDEVSALIPASLTSDLLVAIKPTEIDEKTWIDNCRFIVHCIIHRQYYKGPEDLDEFIPLYSKIIKRFVGNYRLYLDELISAGIILEDSSYSTETGRSKRYKLTKPFQSSQMRYVTISSRGIRKAKLNYQREKVTSKLPRLKPLAKLTYWLSSGQLTLEKKEALTCIERLQERFNKNIKEKYIEPKVKSALIEHFQCAQYWSKHQIEHWDTSHFTIDNAGGRLYSALTRLPTIHRNYLSYQGHPLVSIDLKNSQPFHMLFLLTSGFWRKTRGLCLKVLLPELYQHLKHIGNPIHHLSLPIMCRKLTHIADLQYDKATTFDQLVLSGKLYEFINHEFYGKFTKNQADRFATRPLSKQEFLRMMYHNPTEKYSESKGVFKLFSEYFPQEARIMEVIKSMDYTHFPILLQKLEAQMLLHRIPDVIYDLDHTIPLFTIHDSYITTQEHKEVVKTAIRLEYEKVLGVSPELHTTILEPDVTERPEFEYVINKITSVLQSQPDAKHCENWNFKTKVIEELQNSIAAQVPSIALYNILTGTE